MVNVTQESADTIKTPQNAGMAVVGSAELPASRIEEQEFKKIYNMNLQGDIDAQTETNQESIGETLFDALGAKGSKIITKEDVDNEKQEQPMSLLMQQESARKAVYSKSPVDTNDSIASPEFGMEQSPSRSFRKQSIQRLQQELISSDFEQ